MVVRFSGGEEGRYLYPQSFESTLEIKDKAFSEVIEKDMAEHRKALAEKQKRLVAPKRLPSVILLKMLRSNAHITMAE